MANGTWTRLTWTRLTSTRRPGPPAAVLRHRPAEHLVAAGRVPD
ncbi:hypothetical protein [Blastococcus saxobsidens]|nr:hypothetical protein [Blastococcus saxobsidens]